MHVYDRPSAYRLLGSIYVGDASAMERWVIRDGLLHHLAPLLIGAALLGLGVIALSLWRGRSDSTLFLLLAAGTLLWGVQQILNQWPSPVLLPPHQGVLILSMYIWYPMLLAVFFMRFAYVRWRLYELGAAALAILAAPALYAGRWFEQFAMVSTLLRAAALIWISIALGAVLRYAWRERSIKGAMLLIAERAASRSLARLVRHRVR